MHLIFTERFWRSYHRAPPEVQRAFDRRAPMLAADLRHPSLHAKKYDQAQDIWQARVNKDWRFYFLIQEKAYILLDMMSHPK